MLRDDPSARVLILSASGEQDDVLEAVKAGATGYLVKSASSPSWSTPCGGWRAATPCSRRGWPGLVLGEFRRLSEPTSDSAATPS